jgi:HEAT repeat protein
MYETLRLTLLSIILSVLVSIFIILFAATLRRILHARKYRELDKQRELFRKRIKNALDSGDMSKRDVNYRSSPKSIKFQAIEDVLLELLNEEKYKNDVKELFVRLGYISFYEKRLKSRDVITKASAIDKLGKMLSESSTDKLINLLKTKNAEIISVTVRSLSKIGSIKTLKGILEHIPYLLKESLIAKKTIETSLTNFDINGIPLLLKYAKKYNDTGITASVLGVLNNLKIAESSFWFAVENLKSEDPEVRAKALKLLGQSVAFPKDFDPSVLLPSLEDPVWYVKLQAAKAIGNIKYKKAISILGALLLDDNWQVRNAAATALTKFDDNSIDIFLRALRYKDIYAKASICEEIEKTNYIYRLIENLGSKDKEIYEKSREILQIMHSFNFSTPLGEYVKKSQNDKIRSEINQILNEEVKE